MILTRLKSLLTRLFLGEEILEQVDSPINGRLKVSVDILGHLGIFGGGISQSGGMTDKIYLKAINYLRNQHGTISRVLILGFGAGTFATILQRYYPQATITGVDLDPLIVDLGKRYFLVNTIAQLDIHIADAFDFVRKDQQHYDLIFVDLYQGQEFPTKFTTPEFLLLLKERLTNHESIVLFNRLNWSRHKKTATAFLPTLRSHFSRVNTLSTDFNLLFFCWK